MIKFIRTQFISLFFKWLRYVQVIIGHGNVALDCARIILLAGNDRLFHTDITSSVLDHLSQSSIRNVSIIGRRGPLDVRLNLIFYNISFNHLIAINNNHFYFVTCRFYFIEMTYQNP